MKVRYEHDPFFQSQINELVQIGLAEVKQGKSQLPFKKVFENALETFLSQDYQQSLMTVPNDDGSY